MSDLTAQERRKIERAFGMGSGYVLNFSNRTFSEFFEDNFGLNIYDEKYNAGSGSKANRMRAFWDTESNQLVGRALAALVDDWKEFRNPDSPRDPPDDLVKIVERLKSGASVPDIAAVVSPTDDETFEALAKSVRDCIEKDQPELGLDRLHTYLVKYFRLLGERHDLNSDKDKPLHSLVGEYIKAIKQKGLIESEMTERILKGSISVMESFNKVRNDHSLAHGNKVLNYNESLLIFGHVTSSIIFIESVESKAKNQSAPASPDVLDDIPF